MNPELIIVPIESIEAGPQPRTTFDEGGIKKLAQSIEQTGLQQPLLCVRTKKGVRLIDGERRLRALKSLGRTEAQVLVLPGELAEADRLARLMVSNLQRQDFNPIERALGIRALMDEAKLTADAVSKLLGLSPATVSKALGLLRLPDSLKAHVASGAIPPDIGYLLSGVEDETEQQQLADEVLGNRLTREALTRKLKRVRRQQETQRGARVTATLGPGKTVMFVGNELTLDTVIEWLEQLTSKARKAKTQGLTLQTFTSALRDQSKAGRNS